MPSEATLKEKEPTPSPLQRMKSSFVHRRPLYQRILFPSLRTRTRKRLAILFAVAVVAVWALHEAHCIKHRCVSRVGFYGGVGGGAVLPQKMPDLEDSQGSGDGEGETGRGVEWGVAAANDGEMVVIDGRGGGGVVQGEHTPGDADGWVGKGKWVDDVQGKALKGVLDDLLSELGIGSPQPAPSHLAVASPVSAAATTPSLYSTRLSVVAPPSDEIVPLQTDELEAKLSLEGSLHQLSDRIGAGI